MAKIKTFHEREPYGVPEVQDAYREYDRLYTYYWNAINTYKRYPTQMECDQVQGAFNRFHRLRKQHGLFS